MSKEYDPSLDQNRHLHICPECKGDKVQPTFWEQAEERGYWRVGLRCPECEHREVDTFSEIEIDEFDEQLDLGTIALTKTLKGLERSNMSDMASSFITALQTDLITADDFRR